MTSHWEPRSLHGYQRILSRDTEAGWLEMKIKTLDPWARKWCEFNMGERCFTWGDSASSPMEERKRIPLDDILMVETDTKNNGTFMRLVTAERKYYCRADSADDIRGWVFTFQRAATLDQISATTARLNEMKLHDPRTATGRSPAVGAGSSGIGSGLTRIPSKQGTSAMMPGGSMPMAVASSVATSSMGMPISMASSVHSGGGAGGFLTRKPSDQNNSYNMDMGGFKQNSTAVPLGQPLNRVPSMSIFGPLDRNTSSSSATAAVTSRIGSSASTSSDFWSDATRSTTSISSSASTNFFQRDSPKAVANELRAMSKSVETSGPLGRSPCIPIMPNLDRLVGSSETKLAGSFRDEPAAGRSSLSEVIAASPTGKLMWSPERTEEKKVVPPSPTMSPYRRRGDSDDGGMFQLDEDDVRSKQPWRPDIEYKKTVDPRDDPRREPLKISVQSGKIRWTSGLALEQGRCRYMEDRGVNHANAEVALRRYSSGEAPGVISDSEEDCSGYFGIYDGHDGNQASEYIHKVLHFEIMQHRLFETDIETAMIETCKIVDDRLLAQFRKEDVHCGSTALGAFICKGRLTVFSVGDCRAVLCRNNEPFEMNDPHRPLKLEETLRIERANGWVTTERVINLLQKRVDLTDPEIADIVGLNIEADTSYDVGRVIGDVSVSRAFGDPDYKGFVRGEDVPLLLSWPQNHNKMFYDDIIISEPEMMAVNLTDEDEFLIMASDGVWDVMNPEQAVRKVKNEISAGTSAEDAARALCALALRLGSSDNISAIVVIFEHS